MKAVEIKSLECVKLLLNAGANPNITCRDERHVLEYAIQEYGDECITITEHLLSINKFELHSTEKLSLVHQTCLARRHVKVEKTIDLLVNHGVDLNCVEGKGR